MAVGFGVPCANSVGDGEVGGGSEESVIAVGEAAKVG